MREKAKHLTGPARSARKQPKKVAFKNKYDEGDKLRKAREAEKKMIEKLKRERGTK